MNSYATEGVGDGYATGQSDGPALTTTTTIPTQGYDTDTGARGHDTGTRASVLEYSNCSDCIIIQITFNSGRVVGIPGWIQQATGRSRRDERIHRARPNRAGSSVAATTSPSADGRRLDREEPRMTTTTRNNKELVRRVFEALNGRDMDAFAETHATDAVLHDHDEEFHGVEASIEHERTIYEAFPDMEYRLEEILAEGDLVACRWTVAGTHEGEFEGVPPTGEAVEIPASGLMRVDDGQITEAWLTYDRLGLMQQLGVVDPPTA